MIATQTTDYRSQTINLIFSLCLLWLSACSSSSPSSQEQLPNIVLILADDMGYGDIQAYNPDNPIPTPHLNQLAAQGMRFTDAHSGSSVCTPNALWTLDRELRLADSAQKGGIIRLFQSPHRTRRTYLGQYA